MFLQRIGGEAKTPTRFPRPSRSNDYNTSNPVGGYYAISSPAENNLVKRVGKEVADRLIANVSHRFPDKSRQWCAEKALYDFERDCRS